jgi:RNA polymerase sigma factor (sigma-70 family)
MQDPVTQPGLFSLILGVAGAGTPRRSSAPGLEGRFLDNLELIEALIASTCRRHNLYGADADDFASTVKLKLIEDDYGILRKFSGRSSLKTFLATVIANLLRDFRIGKWGKWRPSAAAKRLGSVATRLETLLYRDGHTFTEATRILLTNHQVGLTELELADLVSRLPPRTTRRFETDAGLEQMEVDARADDEMVDRERAAAAARLEEALGRALAELPDEDRWLLQLHFQEGLTIAVIAKRFGLEQRRLYTRKERCGRQLRQSLADQGLSAEEVSDLLGWEGLSIRVRYDAQGKRPRGPSTE